VLSIERFERGEELRDVVDDVEEVDPEEVE
jgi:hypothetical protein